MSLNSSNNHNTIDNHLSIFLASERIAEPNELLNTSLLLEENLSSAINSNNFVKLRNKPVMNLSSSSYLNSKLGSPNLNGAHQRLSNYFAYSSANPTHQQQMSSTRSDSCGPAFRPNSVILTTNNEN